MTTYELVNVLILIATLVAIFVGPVIAVKITRDGDNKREDRTRKVGILSTLMRTRQARLSFDHVTALNLIQLEFYDDEAIQSAYSTYIAHLNRAVPTDGAQHQAFIEERNDHFINLLHQIGKRLGYGFDKRDLGKLAYGPVGWYEDENAVKMIRGMAMDVLTGKTSLSVLMRQAPILSDKFPPAPVAVTSEKADIQSK